MNFARVSTLMRDITTPEMKAARPQRTNLSVRQNNVQTSLDWINRHPANENRKEQSQMTNGKVITLIEAKIQPQRRAELVEAAPSISAARAGRTRRGGVLPDRAKGRCQYICFLRNLQFTSRTGFSSATGFHENIPCDAKKRAGWGPSANKSGRIGSGSTGRTPIKDMKSKLAQMGLLDKGDWRLRG